MAPKLYRGAEVCEIAQLQSYVLRSWEKEFPGIGLQKSDEGARLYRQSDVDQVLLIKQLVFGEGLTVSGARRRLDQQAPAPSANAAAEAAEVIEALGADARKRIGDVREGLRSLLRMLNGGSHDVRPAIAAPRAASAGAGRGRAVTQRGKLPSRSTKIVTARGKAATGTRGKPAAKRKRASA